MDTPQMPASLADGGTGVARRSGNKDLALLRRAVRERWPISDEVRSALPEFLAAILAGAEDERARVAAARVLIEADKLNMAQMKIDEGIPDRVDITSGGKPLATTEDLKAVSDDELRRRIADLEGRVGTAGEGPPGP